MEVFTMTETAKERIAYLKRLIASRKNNPAMKASVKQAQDEIDRLEAAINAPDRV